MSEHNQGPLACQRFKVVASDGALVTRIGTASGQTTRLPTGSIVTIAQVSQDGQSVRISSPSGWVALADLAAEAPEPGFALDYPTFEANNLRVERGDFYGLEFPFTMEQLEEAGPDFLTQAFRAAGTISADNAVTQIVSLTPLGIMGASENAFLTVAYARQEPGLSAELFIKFPPLSPGHKFALSAQSRNEVALLRFSRNGILPVPVARYYFADYCQATTNYIVITDRVAFGKEPIEPAYRKAQDHMIPAVEEHYKVLAQSLARLVAAHKTGALGREIEALFPYAGARRVFFPIQEPAAAVDKLIDFVGRIAPHLFVEGAADPAFLEQWRDDLLFGIEHEHTVIDYLHADVDYVGLCHPNLNVDNAWYWRDEAGKLHCGLLDWGGAGQLSFGQALGGMLMMPEPERHLTIVRDSIETFASEYEAITGLILDREKLEFHYKASLYSTAVCYIVGIVVHMFAQFSEAEWKSMANRFDNRLIEGGLSAGVIWLDNILREWKHGLMPGEACRRIVAGTAP